MKARRPIVLVIDNLRVQEEDSLDKAEKQARRMIREREAETAVVYVPKRIVTRTAEGTRTQHVRGNGRPESLEPVYTFNPDEPAEQAGAA